MFAGSLNLCLVTVSLQQAAFGNVCGLLNVSELKTLRMLRHKRILMEQRKNISTITFSIFSALCFVVANPSTVRSLFHDSDWVGQHAWERWEVHANLSVQLLRGSRK